MMKILLYYYLANAKRDERLEMERRNSVNKKVPDSLYELCLTNLVNYVQKSRLYRYGLQQIPDSILMDVYYKMYQERRLCILGSELSELAVFIRLLRLFGTHQRLIQCFQAVTEHGIKLPYDLATTYVKRCNHQDNDLRTLTRNYLIDIGLRLGGFLNEAGWYAEAQTVLLRCQALCLSAADTTFYKRLTLECCHRLLRTQSAYCCFPAAAKTYELALQLLGFPPNAEHLETLPVGPYALSQMVDKAVQTEDLGGPEHLDHNYSMRDIDAVSPIGRNCVEGIDNLIIRLYKEFSLLFFCRCDYNAAYKWSMEALRLLTPQTPNRITVEVIRACGKACVVKRKFGCAGVLLRQAAGLAGLAGPAGLAAGPAGGGAARAHALQDLGFYLLNVDSIHHSVAVYEEALTILRHVFGRESLHVATAQEDLAYALYVMEYSSGRFYKARDHAERAIRIIQNLVPPDHLLLASAKRVKALILEEIALDTPAGHDTSEPSLLEESEALHQAALHLSMIAFGEKNVQTAKHYGNLGRLYQSMQKYQDAEAMHLKAIAIKEELLGPDDYEVGLSVGHLASLYNYHMNQHAAAEHLYLRSIAISLKLYGERYSGLEYDYRGLVHAFTQLKRHHSADTYTMLLRRWYQLREESRAQPQPAIGGDEGLLSLNELQKYIFNPNVD